ncbi:unnamed protein product [Gongylonema pulchrum]|uniref:Uncharacterized protein n=1 Tax=Gongylonema pulchrum TaxID=637853 RepID=A0A183DX47_9BILA|nr:unnamed protein product [Gongylonema pulchrum]
MRWKGSLEQLFGIMWMKEAKNNILLVMQLDIIIRLLNSDNRAKQPDKEYRGLPRTRTDLALSSDASLILLNGTLNHEKASYSPVEWYKGSSK